MPKSPDHWWPDVFHTIDEASDADDLFRRLLGLVGTLGFSYCCYGVRASLASDTARVRVFDCYPPGWMSHYLQQEYLLVDPTVKLAAKSTELIVWSDELFRSASCLWSDAREHGLKVGVAQSTWTALGLFGLLSLARDSGTLSPAELRELKPKLQWITESTHRKMSAFLQHAADEPKAPLSMREEETLRWTAEGKTAWEISQILQISESTVVFHLKNAVGKLNSQTKVQAVAKATALGLLVSGDVEHRGPLGAAQRGLASKATHN